MLIPNTFKESLPFNIGFQRINDGHKTYELVPDSSIDKGIHCGDELLNAFHRVNMGFNKRLRHKGMSYVYHTKTSVSYEIYLTEQNIKFTLSIPTKYDSFVHSKIKTSWKKIGVNDELEDYLHTFENDESLMVDMSLERHYFLSLLTDRRENAPLDSILNMTRQLKDGDKLLFQLLLEPLTDWWKVLADQQFSAYKNGKDVKNQTSAIKKIWFFLWENILSEVVSIVEMTIDSIMGIEEVKVDKRRRHNIMASEIDIDKTKTQFNGFNTKIRLYSYSKNSMRRKENLNGLIVAMRSLDNDNSLKASSMKKVVKIKRDTGTLSFLFPNVLNTKELSQIICMPNKEMQKTYTQLKAIRNQQTDMPKLAFDDRGFDIGKINIGGAMTDIRLSHKPDDKCKSKLLLCEQGGGKTTMEQNYIYQCYLKKEPCIILDYVKELELSKPLLEHIPNAIVYNMFDYARGNDVKGLGYNEVFSMLDSNDCSDIEDASQYITSMVMKLLNGLTMGATEELSSQMTKYLASACRVAFINKSTVIMDIPRILSDIDTRNKFISKALSSGVYADNDVDIINLRYLTIDKGHDKNGNHILENRSSEVRGILNRFASIESLDKKLVKLFNNPVSLDIDFNKHIDNDDIVFIQIPQGKFLDESVRDVLCTFFATKLWLCVQARNNEKPAHLVFDEIKMIPNTTQFLSQYITQFRRYRLSTLFASHTTAQFEHAFDEINSSGLQLFILSGVKHKAIKSIENDIKGFTWEEIQEMKPHHALCLTSYDQERYEFVVKLNDAFYKTKKTTI